MAAACAVAMLLAVIPAHAQRLSLSERVTRLEQTQQGRSPEQGGTLLVNQVQALQSQVQQLQGKIEELQHQLQRLKQNNKDQYVDLDVRLRKLAGDASSSVSSSPAPAVSTTAVGTSGKDEAQADPQAAQDTYNSAFTALRNGQFEQSSRQFRSFIQHYPASSLAPNAYYWLGESYYAAQNFDIALQTFQHLLKLYPDNGKAPGALLKTGYCQDALKQEDAAQRTLHAVIEKYPGSSVGKLAQQRLQDIRLRSAN